MNSMSMAAQKPATLGLAFRMEMCGGHPRCKQACAGRVHFAAAPKP